MSYINVTMILPADLAPLARSLAAHLAGPPGDGMWLTGLEPDGTVPDAVPSFVSSGPVGAEFEPLLTDADALWGAVQAATAGGMESPMHNPVGSPREATMADCEALVAAAEVVRLEDESPFDTFARLGLELVQETEE